MKKIIVNSLALFGLLSLAACSTEPALPDLSTIPWISDYGYDHTEIFPIIAGGQVPGPQVKVTVNTERKYLLIDVNTIDFMIRDNIFRDANFEPQRMSNRISVSSEMMFEEGFLHNVSFLNMNYPILYVSLIKRSSVPFRARGIIGRNFLIDGQLTIDMQNKILAYSTAPAVSLRNLVVDSNLVDINLKHGNSNFDGLLKFYCIVNGTKYLATLSTRLATTEISTDLARTITGKNSSHTADLETLKIGAREFQDLSCNANEDLLTLEPDNSETINIVIGMDVVSQCIWTINFTDGWILVQ